MKQNETALKATILGIYLISLTTLITLLKFSK